MSEDTLNTPEPRQPEPSPETVPTVQAEAAPVVGRKRWIAAAAAAVGVALFAVPFLRAPEDRLAAENHPASAPTGATCAAKSSVNFDFTLKDASGATVKLSDYKGKVVLLNFWATWCGPCKLEIPEFVEAYSKFRDKGFVILGVLSEDDPSQQDLQAFMGEYKMNYPVLRMQRRARGVARHALGAADLVRHRPQGPGVLEAHGALQQGSPRAGDPRTLVV